MIIDANPAALPIAERLWGKVRLGGAFLPPLLDGHPSLQAFYEAKEQGEIEVGSGGRQYAVRLIPLQVRHKRTCSLLIITDITERKLFEDQLVKKATRDGLTQLYNRQHFLELLDQGMKHSRSVKEPISLLLMDLDEFKAINDRCGHLSGDRVLKHFAHLLGEAVEGIGAAELMDARMTLEGWYHQADLCLYESKNNGRNRTTLANV